MPKASSFSRFTRGVRHTVRAFASTKHPVLVHIVPMRRCNLACTYCNEFDKTSDPVPIDVMLERIDKLAEFGSSVITISGGEPMMHPQIYDIIKRIRYHGMIAGLISSGSITGVLLANASDGAGGILWNPAAWFVGVYRWIAFVAGR